MGEGKERHPNYISRGKCNGGPLSGNVFRNLCFTTRTFQFRDGAFVRWKTPVEIRCTRVDREMSENGFSSTRDKRGVWLRKCR